MCENTKSKKNKKRKGKLHRYALANRRAFGSSFHLQEPQSGACFKAQSGACFIHVAGAIFELGYTGGGGRGAAVESTSGRRKHIYLLKQEPRSSFHGSKVENGRHDAQLPLCHHWFSQHTRTHGRSESIHRSCRR
jgi:hypothetical protein